MAGVQTESFRQGGLHVLPGQRSVSAFEPLKPLTRNLDINTLIWVGGLFDTPGSVDYPFALAQALPMSWSLVCAGLSSAGLGWGTSSIAQDARELDALVAYFKARRPGGKVVIMGHSTGCQDCMEYVVGPGSDGRNAVDGIVLQAPVSDREALDVLAPEETRRAADVLALEMIGRGEDREVLPLKLTEKPWGRCALTAKRWLDISSPGPAHDGADDYFSSDLETQRLAQTFGKFPAHTPLCILPMGEDEFMKPDVDKEALWRRWASVVKAGGGVVDENSSGVVKGASHNLNDNDESAVRALLDRVVAFVGNLAR